jgi:hypothetical protein
MDPLRNQSPVILETSLPASMADVSIASGSAPERGVPSRLSIGDLSIYIGPVRTSLSTNEQKLLKQVFTPQARLQVVTGPVIEADTGRRNYQLNGEGITQLIKLQLDAKSNLERLTIIQRLSYQARSTSFTVRFDPLSLSEQDMADRSTDVPVTSPSNEHMSHRPQKIADQIKSPLYHTRPVRQRAAPASDSQIASVLRNPSGKLETTTDISPTRQRQYIVRASDNRNADAIHVTEDINEDANLALYHPDGSFRTVNEVIGVLRQQGVGATREKVSKALREAKGVERRVQQPSANEEQIAAELYQPDGSLRTREQVISALNQQNISASEQKIGKLLREAKGIDKRVQLPSASDAQITAALYDDDGVLRTTRKASAVLKEQGVGAKLSRIRAYGQLISAGTPTSSSMPHLKRSASQELWPLAQRHGREVESINTAQHLYVPITNYPLINLTGPDGDFIEVLTVRHHHDAILMSGAQNYNIRLDSVFPIRDPAHPHQVHPDFADLSNPQRCAFAEIGPIKILKRFERLLYAYAKDHFACALSSAELIGQLSQACQAELRATAISEDPPSSRYIEIRRLALEQCQGEGEETLVGEYGGLLRDYASQPSLGRGLILGIFAGAWLQDDGDTEVYRKCLGAALADRVLGDYATNVQNRRSRKVTTWAPYGGGNQTQYYNSVFAKNLQGEFKVDEAKTNAVLIPFSVQVLDRHRQERSVNMMMAVQHRAIENGGQIRLNYGAGYSLTMPERKQARPIKIEPLE